MIDAAERAQAIAAGRQRGDSKPDDVEALALVRLLEIMGEAARNVSDEVRTKYPQGPSGRSSGPATA